MKVCVLISVIVSLFLCVSVPVLLPEPLPTRTPIPLPTDNLYTLFHTGSYFIVTQTEDGLVISYPSSLKPASGTDLSVSDIAFTSAAALTCLLSSGMSRGEIMMVARDNQELTETIRYVAGVDALSGATEIGFPIPPGTTIYSRRNSVDGIVLAYPFIVRPAGEMYINIGEDHISIRMKVEFIESGFGAPASADLSELLGHYRWIDVRRICQENGGRLLRHHMETAIDARSRGFYAMVENTPIEMVIFSPHDFAVPVALIGMAWNGPDPSDVLILTLIPTLAPAW